METKMSAEGYLAPNLNRFVILLRQKSTATLELHCHKGQLKVNFNHDVGFVEEATTNENILYSDVLKKNIKASQVNRLRRRAEERAEKANNKHKEAEQARQSDTEKTEVLGIVYIAEQDATGEAEKAEAATNLNITRAEKELKYEEEKTLKIPKLNL